MWEEKETAELKWFNIQKKMKSYIELVPKEMSGDKSIDGELIHANYPNTGITPLLITRRMIQMRRKIK